VRELISSDTWRTLLEDDEGGGVLEDNGVCDILRQSCGRD